MGAWPGMNLFKGNKAKSIEAKFVQQTSLKAVANHGGAVCVACLASRIVLAQGRTAVRNI